MLLNDNVLLLAQPDLSSPGWVVITTLWPLWQVQSFVDRSDPRVLQLGLRAARGGARPGDVSSATAGNSTFAAFAPARPGGGGDESPSVTFNIELIFEDTKRCHEADVHISKRRQEVRAQLKRGVIGFVEGCATAPTLFFSGDQPLAINVLPH